MIDIQLEGNKLIIAGEICLGYIGTYKDSQIQFVDTIEEIREWKMIADNLDENCDDPELLDYLDQFYNAYIEKIAKNIKQINDTFLLKVFLDMESCGMEFWEIDKLVVKDKMPADPDGIYEPYWDTMSELSSKYVDAPNDGSVEKEDIEQILRNNYPMFDMDAFIKGIVPDVICLCEDGLSFQCSDAFHQSILCCAYDLLDEDLCFTDWHNF